MKQTSAARSKGTKTNHAAQLVPAPGTKLREMWDLFQSHRGLVVKRVISQWDYARLSSLRDVYGLDIRLIRRRHWCLVGEWLEDGTYVDYVAPNQEDLEG